VKQDITTESKALKKVKRGLYFSLLGCVAFIGLSLFILFNVPGFQGLFMGLLGTVTFGTFLFLGLQALWREPAVPKHEGFLPDPKSPSWAETVFSIVISVVTAVLFGIIEPHLPRLPNLDFLGIAAHPGALMRTTLVAASAGAVGIAIFASRMLTKKKTLPAEAEEEQDRLSE
jgi:hypothetical protein